jgi:hypothetical protein
MSAIQAADVPTLNQNTTGTAANVTGIVAVANGGSGTATPSLVAGTNVTITGSWPNQTIAASGGGGGSALTISNKTGAYTVVAGDLGTIINCTSGTFTVSLTAAATLGSGFNCWVWNTGTGAITIDPNAAETIDGIATLTLRNGEGTQIVCDGTNWQTGDQKEIRSFATNTANSLDRPVASGSVSVAIGAGTGGNTTTASGIRSVAIGWQAKAGDYQTALGVNGAGNGAVAETGNGAMALGGSYASGADSFAAAIANNTSSFGATGGNSIAIGASARATAIGSLAISANRFGNAQSTAAGAIAIGDSVLASGSLSTAIGRSVTASAGNAVAFGTSSISNIIGKYAFSSGQFAANGDSQTGTFVLRRPTTDATATVLTTDNSAPAADDQIILPDNSAYAFTGTIIARQQAAGGSNFAAWEIKGAILRGANAASTTIGSFNINALSATAGASAWVVALSADTTNGGLAVTVTGAAATNIRWVATVQTSEVTFA